MQEKTAMHISGARHKTRYRLKTTWLHRLLIMVCVALLSGPLSAITVDEVPNIHLKDARQYVTDPSAILSTAARDSINLMLGQLEQGSGIEVAVVMLPSIGNDDIFDFAHNLFRKWGIGKKKENNGLLVLFVMDQHKVRFTTGYGLEGALTDALSKRIQMNEMVPAFKEGKWDEGMMKGVRATVAILKGEVPADQYGATSANGNDEELTTFDVIAISMVFIVIILIIVLACRDKKCPKCKKHAMKTVSTQRLKIALGHGRVKRIIRTTYVCQNCGHQITHDTDDNDDDKLNAALAAASIARMAMRGSSGGSTGGSFGGGSTGGGGSTSGW